MLALGLTLVVSVAAAPPAVTHEKLASTYDEAYCDPADGGECADEVLVDFLPTPAAVMLDCESPLIAGMIGSCDLPAPVVPTLHVPTLRNAGSGFNSAPSSSPEHLRVVATNTSLDGAISAFTITLHPAPVAGQLVAFHATSTKDAPRSRLDRPPRA
ncbi:MAG TPA: hypothetical protein VGL86_09885 [Polyangia bacterium]|jgi:hypothetical protein